MNGMLSNSGLVKEARKHWESYAGREYVAYEHFDPSDPQDAPLSYGVAVYENGRLVAIGFMPHFVGDFDGFGLRMDETAEEIYCSSVEQYCFDEPMTWESVDLTAASEIEDEWNHFQYSGPIRFRSRLALKEAYVFGFIREIPQGYLEADRASRRPVPGRLTQKSLRQLILDGKVKPSQTIYLTGEKFMDTAPNRRVRVHRIGAAFDQKEWVADTHEEAMDLVRKGRPFMIAEFPQRVFDNGRLWEYPMDSRFLCWRDNKLIWVSCPEDEWFIDQYEEAETQGKSW